MFLLHKNIWKVQMYSNINDYINDDDMNNDNNDTGNDNGDNNNDDDDDNNETNIAVIQWAKPHMAIFSPWSITDNPDSIV